MKTTHKIKEIRKMRKLGYTLREIGESMSISRQRVHQILSKAEHLTEGAHYCARCTRVLTKIDR